MKKIRFIYILIFFLGVIACDTNVNKNAEYLDSKLDKELEKISFSLALISANTNHIAKMSCALNEVYDKYEKNSVEEIDGFIKEFSRDFENECSVFRVAKVYTDKVVNEVVSKGKNFEGGYLFYVWKGRDVTSGWEESQPLGLWISDKGDEPVGLFETVDDCVNAEKLLRRDDYSTRECRSWKEEYKGIEVGCYMGTWPYKKINFCDRN